jgi:hypothetical protein
LPGTSPGLTYKTPKRHAPFINIKIVKMKMEIGGSITATTFLLPLSADYSSFLTSLDEN